MRQKYFTILLKFLYFYVVCKHGHHNNKVIFWSGLPTIQWRMLADRCLLINLILKVVIQPCHLQISWSYALKLQCLVSVNLHSGMVLLYCPSGVQKQIHQWKNYLLFLCYYWCWFLAMLSTLIMQRMIIDGNIENYLIIHTPLHNFRNMTQYWYRAIIFLFRFWPFTFINRAHPCFLPVTGNYWSGEWQVDNMP